jgi:hypothetical protein
MSPAWSIVDIPAFFFLQRPYVTHEMNDFWGMPGAFI